ncbi:hypothetical protein NDR87_29695 [Nocardia sp. CDC159]|uniref:Uncharacterized protein n=1 Tax=Nocardia pulmonis TaxID=2951408 RepID=A0A9X2EDU7_9NOCA|nr:MULTISPECIES: hypothetical protein [Nocardia]MCM6777645.1 hypothetical protein [Nocardia pulmonis]MCM6790551.1 hypothetical protein [Nocardia sp. CDC159]
MRISVQRAGDNLRVRMRLDVNRRRWLITQICLGALVAIGLFTGLWAALAPESWYRSFPGFGLTWVSVDGPYNHHLATDVGAFFLGLTAVTAAALYYGDSLLARVAGLGWLVFGTIHLIYHVAHKPGEMPTGSYVLSLLSVVLLPALGLAALLAAPRERIRLRDPAPMTFRLPRRRNR